MQEISRYITNLEEDIILYNLLTSLKSNDELNDMLGYIINSVKNIKSYLDKTSLSETEKNILDNDYHTLKDVVVEFKNKLNPNYSVKVSSLLMFLSHDDKTYMLEVLSNVALNKKEALIFSIKKYADIFTEEYKDRFNQDLIAYENKELDVEKLIIYFRTFDKNSNNLNAHHAYLEILIRYCDYLCGE